MSEELTSISSGIKASSQKENDLFQAYTKREAKMKEFTGEFLQMKLPILIVCLQQILRCFPQKQIKGQSR